MFTSWTTTLRVATHAVTILVTAPETGDLLKARLPPAPRHPRALLTMLEGLALWRGEPLRAVISAASPSTSWGSGLFGDELWPAESQLVRFTIAGPGCRKARLRGLGDFRALRLAARSEAP